MSLHDHYLQEHRDINIMAPHQHCKYMHLSDNFFLAEAVGLPLDEDDSDDEDYMTEI